MWLTFAPGFVYLIIFTDMYLQSLVLDLDSSSNIFKFVTDNPFHPRIRTISAPDGPKNEIHGHKLNREDKDLMKYLEKAKFTVYRADIELAIGAWMYNEVLHGRIFAGDYLKNLKNFTDVLIVFNPLHKSNLRFLKDFRRWLDTAFRIFAYEVPDWAECWEGKFHQVFNTNDYVGCHGKEPHLRGFPCSLWQLFHFLTVEGSDFDEGWFRPIYEPGHVIRAITEFVKVFFYFRCPKCAVRFYKIAQRKTFDVRTHDGEIFWLWEVHNEFNKLTGAKSWPSIQICKTCKKGNKWKRDSVLRFLKRVYRQKNHSLYRLEQMETYSNITARVSEPSSESQNCETLDRRRRRLLFEKI